MTQSTLMHSSCVAIDGRGVLLLGRSGSGKSDLALRLMDRGAKLVGDDYLVLRRDGSQLWASAAEALRGKLEIRHLGICSFPFLAEAPLSLVVSLDSIAERLPEPHVHPILGISLPALQLSAFEISTPIKIELALKQGIDLS